MARWLWALLLLASSRAHADPLRLEVTEGGCPLDALEGAIDALAGRDAFDPAADRVVRVEGVDDTPAAHVWMSDATGQLRGPRVVTAATCDELVQAVSVVVVMVLPPAEPPRRAVTPTRVADVDDAAVSPPRPDGTTMRVFAAGAVTGFGSHEQGLAGLEWRHGWASVLISIDHDMSDRVAVGPLAAIELARSDLEVAACAHAGAVAACPVLGGGVISGSPTGLLRERSIASQVLFAGAMAMWEHAISERFAVRAHVQADVLLTTTDLQVDHMSVWRSPRFEGAAGLGIVVLFP
jgi:hypothetical protein